MVSLFPWIGIEPFNFGKQTFDIIAFFWNKILQEISPCSSLFNFLNSFGTEKTLSIFETACIGIWDFLKLLLQVLQMWLFWLAVIWSLYLSLQCHTFFSNKLDDIPEVKASVTKKSRPFLWKLHKFLKPRLWITFSSTMSSWLLLTALSFVINIAIKVKITNISCTSRTFLTWFFWHKVCSFAFFMNLEHSELLSLSVPTFIYWIFYCKVHVLL